METKAPVFVLTGDPGAGKTALCERTIALLQKAGARIAGVVSPPRFEAGRKTGIYVKDIRSGDQRMLAARGDCDGLGWTFDPAGVEWGSDVLRTAASSDVVVVDELGPLELERGIGWVAALTLLRQHRGPALVVVRPSLVDRFVRQFDGRRVTRIAVTPSSPSAEDVAELLLSDIEVHS